MGIRDQFDRLRNYFVEDDDDYDYEDDVQERTAPVEEPARPQPAPVQARPQQAQQTQPVQSQAAPVQPRPRPVAAPTQQPVQPAARNYSAGANSGMSSGYVRSVPSQQNVFTRAASTQVSQQVSYNYREPRVYQDVMELANFVKSGKTVLINFKNMADQQARRSIDFLTGVAYTVDGDIQNIGGQSFIVTPTGVNIDGGKDLSMLAGGGQNFENFDLTY